jgi:hypothetical protein
VGDSFKFTANLIVTGSVTDRTVTWSSSVPSVATVDTAGNVTVLTAGTTSIMATSNFDHVTRGTATVTALAPFTISDGRYIGVTMTKTSDTCAAKGFTFVNSYVTTFTLSNGMTLLVDADPGGTRSATGSGSGTTGSWSGSGRVASANFKWTYALIARIDPLGGPSTIGISETLRPDPTNECDVMFVAPQIVNPQAPIQ